MRPRGSVAPARHPGRATPGAAAPSIRRAAGRSTARAGAGRTPTRSWPGRPGARRHSPSTCGTTWPPARMIGIVVSSGWRAVVIPRQEPAASMVGQRDQQGGRVVHHVQLAHQPAHRRVEAARRSVVGGRAPTMCVARPVGVQPVQERHGAVAAVQAGKRRIENLVGAVAGEGRLDPEPLRDTLRDTGGQRGEPTAKRADRHVMPEEELWKGEDGAVRTVSGDPVALDPVDARRNPGQEGCQRGGCDARSDGLAGQGVGTPLRQPAEIREGEERDGIGAEAVENHDDDSGNSGRAAHAASRVVWKIFWHDPKLPGACHGLATAVYRECLALECGSLTHT